jgi:3,4-dihydroxy-2-butanone 4-phosphate synthase
MLAHTSEFSFDPVEDALRAFERGEFLVVMDDEKRENEGDLICAASLCTTEKMAWMIKHTRSISLYFTENPFTPDANCIPQRIRLHFSSTR